MVRINYYATVFTVYLQHDYATQVGHTSYPCKLAITVEISVPPLMRAWVNTICPESIYPSEISIRPSVILFVSNLDVSPRPVVFISLPRSSAFKIRAFSHDKI